MTPSRVVARLLANTAPADGGCIISLYSTGSHGYSQIGWQDGGTRTMALGHRVAWENAHGPIPADLTIDHLCRNRRCINVEHMRLLTNVENARMNGNWAKTHCLRGHPFDLVNTHWTTQGHRKCRACAEQYRKAA